MRTTKIVLLLCCATSLATAEFKFDFKHKKPVFTKETILGLTVSCIVSSLMSSFGEAKFLAKAVSDSNKPSKMAFKLLASWSALTTMRIAKLYGGPQVFKYWFGQDKKQV